MKDKEIFISKWSNWWSLTRNGKELTEAFRKELESILTPEQDGTKEEILFKVWKEWATDLFGDVREFTFDEFQSDTTWAYFTKAMDEYASLQVAKAVEEKQRDLTIANKLIEQKNEGVNHYIALAGDYSIRCNQLESELSEKEARVKELEDTIRWALGTIGEFPERKSGQGLYWWRNDLLKKSKIEL